MAFVLAKTDITYERFSAKQKAQLIEFYAYHDEDSFIECLSALTFSDFQLEYYPKTGTFVCFISSDSHERHRLASFTKENYTEETDLNPYSILFHPLVEAQIKQASIGDFFCDGINGLELYETHKRVYEKGYTIENYLKASKADQERTYFVFRYNTTKRLFLYTIQLALAVNGIPDYYQLYVGENSSGYQTRVISELEVSEVQSLSLSELQVKLDNLFSFYLMLDPNSKHSDFDNEIRLIESNSRKIMIDLVLDDM